VCTGEKDHLRISKLRRQDELGSFDTMEAKLAVCVRAFQVSRARLLQLLRGTWKHRQFESIPGSAAGDLVAHLVSPESTTPALETHAPTG